MKYSFQLLSVKAFERANKNKTLLPYKKIDRRKDERWNTKLVNARVLEAIVTGQSIPKISKSFKSVLEMDRKSAIRNARTTMTSCENAGRFDSMKEAEAMGIKLEKQWIATHDGRTRDSHLKIDGETVPVDEAFTNDLMYPADPDGDPEEVYNCRCAMISVVAGFEPTDFSWTAYRPYEENKYEENSFVSITDNRKTLQDSLIDAYENHRISNNLKSVPYDPDSELQFIKIDVSKLDAESQNTLKESINTLVLKYDTPLVNIHIMNKQEVLGKSNTFAYVTHNYNTDTAELVINPLKCKDETKLIERIMELRKSGYCAFVPDEYLKNYVYTHEFGHSLINMEQELNNKYNFVNADYDKIRKVRQQVQGVFSEYSTKIGELEIAKREAEMNVILYGDSNAAEKARDLIKQIEKEKISTYSLTNVDDFFAESFVYTEYGGTDNKWANKIREIIDENFTR